MNKIDLTRLVRLYLRHVAWARRSGLAAMDWPEFKSSRVRNTLCRIAA